MIYKLACLGIIEICHLYNVRFNGLGKAGLGNAGLRKANICQSNLKWKFAKWQKGGRYAIGNISKY